MDINNSEAYKYWAGDWHYDEYWRNYEEIYYPYRDYDGAEIAIIEKNLWSDDMADGWDKSEEFIPGWCKEANNRLYLVDWFRENDLRSIGEGKWDHRFYWYRRWFPVDKDYIFSEQYKRKYTVESNGKIHWNRGKWRDDAKIRDKDRRRSRKEKYIYRNGAGDINISGSFFIFI